MLTRFRCFALMGWLLCTVVAAQEAPKATKTTTAKTAITAEVPLAKEHLKAHPGAAAVNARLLTNEEVIRLADSVLSIVKKNGLYSSSAVNFDGTLVSVTAFPITGNRWEASLVKYRDAQFLAICEHYARQADKAAMLGEGKITNYVHVYLGQQSDGGLVAAIGLAGAGNKERLHPRQFPAKIENVAIAVKDLPAKSCDIDTMGEKVLPGEGYVLTPAQVGASKAYFDSLDPKTRAVMEGIIKTDTSNWLVSEKHISKFKVDKAKARQLAIEMWENEAKGLKK